MSTNTDAGSITLGDLIFHISCFKGGEQRAACPENARCKQNEPAIPLPMRLCFTRINYWSDLHHFSYVDKKELTY